MFGENTPFTALGKRHEVSLVLDLVENAVRSDELGHRGRRLRFTRAASAIAASLASDYTGRGRYGFGLHRCKLDPKSHPGPNLKILAGPDRD